MKKEDKSYILLIVLHAVLGMSFFYAPFLAKIYGYAIFFIGIYYVVKTQNANNECLQVAAYVVGSEIILRMTGGNLTYEFSKYEVIIFIFLGMYFKGFSKTAFSYWFFLLLLIPSVIIATFMLNFDTDIKNAIAFNISGPVCLACASLYTYRRAISLNQINLIVLCIGLPILTCTVYLIFYTPNVRDVITGTASNFETSGGFGPNQVATILGLGMFIFMSRVILVSKSTVLLVLNLIIALNIGYRGTITFSRGGMITGFVMIIILLLFLYFKSNGEGKIKLGYVLLIVTLSMLAIWGYSSYQTGGLIDKRYANQDALGRVKQSQFTGREDVAQSEINMFLKNPIAGVGVGKGVEIREQEMGFKIASHNELTRMLAEHGSLGIVGLLILLLTPFVLFIENNFNMYLICFVVFWLLTINHAAMRTAAPAFIYALALLNVQLRTASSGQTQ